MKKNKLLSILIIIFLMACSGELEKPKPIFNPNPQEDPSHFEDFSHLAVIDINASQSREQIAKDYDGTVIVYHPDDGFAIIGLATKPEDGVFESLKENGLYSTVYGSGFNAWAGGWRTWAGGFNAWAGGTNQDATFTENEAFWSQIKLTEGQALAPKLGRDVIVAVIDTGIDYNHPGFENRLAPTHMWQDFIDNDNLPEEAEGDFKGHGTAVAGLVIQAAPNAKILPIRVLKGNGQGNLVSVIKGIDHAIMMGADIINLSLGADDTTDALERMLQYAQEKNIPVVSSVGNQAIQAITHPANWDSFLNYIDDKGLIKAELLTKRDKASIVTAVTSVNAEGKKSSFANYGPVHIAAPGEGILTLYPDNQVVSVSGTSFAAGIISGIYALAKAENKNLSSSAYTFSLIVNSQASWTAEDEDFEKYYELMGGLVDVQRFVANVPIVHFVLGYLDTFSSIPTMGLDPSSCVLEGSISSKPTGSQNIQFLVNNLSDKNYVLYKLNEQGERELHAEIDAQRIWRSVGHENEMWLIADEAGECKGLTVNPLLLSFMVIGDF